MPMLPAANEVQAPLARAHREPRIVLVAHHAPFEAALAHVLEDAGFSVWSVATTREALACVAEFPPDHVLFDLDDEESDGFGFLHEIATAAPDTNVIVCSRDPSMAHLDQKTRDRLGIDAFIQRPCRLDVIVATVSELTAAARAVVRIPLKGAVTQRRLETLPFRANLDV